MNNLKDNNLNKTAGDNISSSVVFRKCIACGKIIDRTSLIRILSEHGTNKTIINPNNKQFGKSKYLCKNEECFKLAIKKKRLKNLTIEDIDKLKKIICIN